MCRIMSMIMLAVLFPMQVHAVDLSGFNKGTSTEYVVPRTPENKTPEELERQKIEEQLAAAPPKPIVVDKSPTNWWLWGSIGLAVLVGSALAFSGGGGGGGNSPPPSGGGGTPTTSTVSGAW